MNQTSTTQDIRYTAHIIKGFRDALAYGQDIVKELENLIAAAGDTSFLPKFCMARYAAALILIPIIVESYRAQDRKIPTIELETLGRRAQDGIRQLMAGRPIEDLDNDEFKPEGGAGRWRVSQDKATGRWADRPGKLNYRFTPGVPSLQSLQAAGFDNAK